MLANYLQHRAAAGESEILLELDQHSVSSLESFDESDSDSESESSSDEERPVRYSSRSPTRKPAPKTVANLRRQTTGSAPNLRGDFTRLDRPKVGGCNERWTSAASRKASSSQFALDLLNGARRSSHSPTNRTTKRSSPDLLTLRTNVSNIASGASNARWVSVPKRNSSPKLVPDSSVRLGRFRVTAPDLLALKCSPPRSPEQKDKSNSRRGAATSATLGGDLLPRLSLTNEKQTPSLLRGSAPDLLNYTRPIRETRSTPSSNARWTSSTSPKDNSKHHNNKISLDSLRTASPKSKLARASAPDLQSLGLKVKIESSARASRNAQWASSVSHKPATAPGTSGSRFNAFETLLLSSLATETTILKRGVSADAALHTNSRWSSTSTSGLKDPLGAHSNHSLSHHDLKRASLGADVTTSPHDSSECGFSFLGDQWSIVKKLPRRHPKPQAHKTKESGEFHQEVDPTKETSMHNPSLPISDTEVDPVKDAKTVVEQISIYQEIMQKGGETGAKAQATLNLCALALNKPRMLTRGSSDSLMVVNHEKEDAPQTRSSLPCRLEGPKQPMRRASIFDISEALQGLEHDTHNDEQGNEDLEECLLQRIPSDSMIALPTRRLSCISEDALSALQRSFNCGGSIGAESTGKLGLRRQLTDESTLTEASFTSEEPRPLPSSDRIPRDMRVRPANDVSAAALGYKQVVPDNAKRFQSRRSSLEKIKPCRKGSMDMEGVGTFLQQPRRKSSMDMHAFAAFQSKYQRKSSIDTAASADYSLDESSCSPFPQLRKDRMGISEFNGKCSGPDPDQEYHIKYSRNHSMDMSECSEVSAPGVHIKAGTRCSIAMTECSDITMSTMQNSFLFESFTSDVFTMLTSESLQQTQVKQVQEKYSTSQDNPTQDAPAEKSKSGCSLPIRRSSVVVSEDCVPTAMPRRSAA